jgi:hypothetical protein
VSKIKVEIKEWAFTKVVIDIHVVSEKALLVSEKALPAPEKVLQASVKAVTKVSRNQNRLDMKNWNKIT